MSRVVHLHIGAPKTGTTYLQDRLRLNTAALGRHGVTVPATRSGRSDMFHFRAALDLLDQDWGGRPGTPRAPGTRWSDASTARSGNVVISHEILAGAKPDKIAKALNDLAGNEVHIVYSARDLGRQLPAAWQESIKQGRKWPFKRFLDQARVAARRGSSSGGIDLPDRPGRAGAPSCRPSGVHVVTVPHDRGPNGDELWLRFCRAFRIDPAWAPLDSERDNRSLGIAETSLLRKLNRRLELGVWRDPVYDALIRELLAQEVLVARNAVPGAPATRPLRLRRAAGRASGSTGSRAAASTWSATWTTSARAVPPRTRSGRTRTGCAPSSSSEPPSTRCP